jgi:hypothetical protein
MGRVKVQLCVTYLQTLALLSDIFQVTLPRNTMGLFRSMSIANLRVSLPSYRCRTHDDWHSDMVLYTAVPLFIFAAAGLGLAGLRWLEHRRQRVIVPDATNLVSSALILLSSLLLIGESTAVFEFFTCVPLDDGEPRLFADMRILCASHHHRQYLP